MSEWRRADKLKAGDIIGWWTDAVRIVGTRMDGPFICLTIMDGGQNKDFLYKPSDELRVIAAKDNEA